MTFVAEVVAPIERIAVAYEDVHDPACTSEVVGRYALCPPDVVDRVVRCAHAARTAWAAMPATERGEYLARAADAVERDLGARAELLTREQGKVLWESQLDLGGASRLLRYYATLAAGVGEEQVAVDERGTTIVRRVPMGVTALIVPWNYPVYLCLMGLAPALIAGNPVVVKPSEFAPLALSQTLASIAAVLPPGVLTVVPGTGAQTGAALVAHPLVRKVVFTGGTTTGRAILRNTADTIKSVSLELGGNDPAIVLDDAVLDDRTIREIRRSVYTCTGQVCFNIKRIYVHRSIQAEFVDRFRAAVDELAVGPGLDPRSAMGPLNNRRQFDSVGRLLDQTRRSGASVTELGRKVDAAGWDRGHFVLPTVVTDLPHEHELVACEQFGPTVPVIPFDDEAQAIAWANDTEFGLAASVWSADIDHALHLARHIESGSVFVNSHRVGSSDQTMPFGGVKQSGLGRNHGMWAIDECMELQAISHRPDTSAFPGPP